MIAISRHCFKLHSPESRRQTPVISINAGEGSRLLLLCQNNNWTEGADVERSGANSSAYVIYELQTLSVCLRVSMSSVWTDSVLMLYSKLLLFSLNNFYGTFEPCNVFKCEK